MTLFRQKGNLPVWEPIPWDMNGVEVKTQREGFMARADRHVRWDKVSFNDWPAEGVFGKSREWFADHDVNYFATEDGEDMLLIQNVWHGFPDPPEWGLATREAGRDDYRWKMWGHFSYLPKAWDVPGETDAQD